jgi:thiol-disulfide isomerase/thioredoxin
MRVHIAVLLMLSLFLLTSGCSDSPPSSAGNRPPRQESGNDAGRPSPGAGVASLFRLPAVDGRPVTVRTPAALYFFTTWCEYCRRAHPEIQAAAERAQAKGWRLYGIDVGERPDVVNAYIQRYHPRYPILLDQNSRVANQYKVPGYPTFILIDKDANIVYNGHSIPKGF